MRAVDIIIKKRDKQELSKEEINFLIENFTSGEIPDYQMSAFAMAVLLNGMSHQEITDLTLAMAASGDQLDLSEFGGLVIDKHSTGGVGDKTTLVVAPIVAACGLPVGKMSGRGLGFSGGTIDKLESIPGFKSDLSTEEFITQLREHGIVLTGQSLDLAPADGKLYALRDVTGTVQSIPLIASSVMSKKIASGANAIALDVKVGRGAFMKNLEEARELAEVMVAIGKLSGRRVIAVLSQMDQPLGVAVGNALEMKEAIEMLNGHGPDDFHVHCIDLSAYMLILGKKAPDLESGRKLAQDAIDDGRALEKFRELIQTQHGDVNMIDHPELLPKASMVIPITADSAGWVKVVDAQDVGESSVEIGAGRQKKGDVIDQAVGIMVRVKVGDRVEAGQTLFDVHVNDRKAFETVFQKLKTSVEISNEPVEPPPYFWGVIGL
ncbi:MAG TPA: pyrimidine-nucleoside phosphorylase [Anaerolineaceae bacterium]|jgi:pyrimidine-nucleoside phosphorylase|nr:pyrimidine-nucleoside phosphorylase [Anaerolineaceae bacterium]